MGRLDESIVAHQKVMALGEKNADRELTAVALGNLGIVYEIRGALSEAEAMYRQALALDEAFGNKAGMASDYGNLGIVYHIISAEDTGERRA